LARTIDGYHALQGHGILGVWRSPAITFLEPNGTMRIVIDQAPPAAAASECLVIPVFEDDAELEGTAHDPALNARLRSIRQSGDFKAAVGELLLLYPENADNGSIAIAGLGKRGDDRMGRAFGAGFAIAKRLGGRARDSVRLHLPRPMRDDLEFLRVLLEGIMAASVGPGLYQKEAARFAFGELRLQALSDDGWDVAALERVAEQSAVVGRSIVWARELVNRAPRDKKPRRLAEQIHDTLAPLGVAVEVWDEDRVARERFGGLLGVSAGSDSPPRLVLLEWKRTPDDPHLALIGKGVTFDSGGLSLKPSASMEDMKSDMSGAATVAAAFHAVASLGLPVHWRGYLPLTENMTGGRALKLGDVLTMRNGVTVEVLNTDAEGRLILADALSHAAEQKPAALVDLATLTGACMVALGAKVAGLFSNDTELKARVTRAAAQAGERCWELPLDDDFADGLKSQVADCKNIGGKWGGAITAAKFLEKFVAGLPWVHLDIAGPSWNETDTASADAGATGCFVRTLVRLAEKNRA
jgi:leucyl aminopeptidase